MNNFFSLFSYQKHNFHNNKKNHNNFQKVMVILKLTLTQTLVQTIVLI